MNVLAIILGIFADLISLAVGIGQATQYFQKSDKAAGNRVLKTTGAVMAVIIVVALVLSFLFGQGSATGTSISSSHDSLANPISASSTATLPTNSGGDTVTTPSPLPTLVVSTSTPDPTDTPVWPTATPVPPPPPPHTVLYTADWSNGLDGWVGPSGWKTSGGQLLFDGTSCCVIIAPYRVPANVPNYEIQAKVQMLSRTNDCSLSPCLVSLGVVGRGTVDASSFNGYNGFSGYLGVYGDKPPLGGTPGYAHIDVYQGAVLGQIPWTLDTSIHTVTVDFVNNTITMYIDGSKVATATDNHYTSGGVVGIIGVYVESTISSFVVTSL